MITLLIIIRTSFISFFFFFNDTATTEIYTLSLHDALPIYSGDARHRQASHANAVVPAAGPAPMVPAAGRGRVQHWRSARSEEHTSELQSQSNLVCRLLLEKKKKPHESYSLHNKCHDTASYT